ncbi:hypothetical protein SAMN02745724_02594 [Pseudoalteromonas denitrificans DSM 6059]|jgi:hypothetical protein|uniref:Uncharacterized protein n=1 Tax=Pseudoalteromonas denitrificans DSM 6059 TaxID=1123010 RepID=A0A1I1M5U4_9GAMM|nr:hypothetical protein SAMN02745724_02594 [Pseudoalteromonas denitrificans DSM 6059]
MILSPEEIEEIFKIAGIESSNYVSIQFDDIPKGNKRRIMCSKGVSDSLIKSMNNSIRKFIPSAILY